MFLFHHGDGSMTEVCDDCPLWNTSIGEGCGGKPAQMAFVRADLVVGGDRYSKEMAATKVKIAATLDGKPIASATYSPGTLLSAGALSLPLLVPDVAYGTLVVTVTVSGPAGQGAKPVTRTLSFSGGE